MARVPVTSQWPRSSSRRTCSRVPMMPCWGGLQGTGPCKLVWFVIRHVTIRCKQLTDVPFLPPHPLVVFVVLTYAFCFHLEVGMLLPVSSANQGSKSQQIWSTRLSVAGFELLSNFKLWAVVRSSWHLILSSPIPAIIHAAQSWSHEDRSNMMNHSTRQLWV